MVKEYKNTKEIKSRRRLLVLAIIIAIAVSVYVRVFVKGMPIVNL